MKNEQEPIDQIKNPSIVAIVTALYQGNFENNIIGSKKSVSFYEYTNDYKSIWNDFIFRCKNKLPLGILTSLHWTITNTNTGHYVINHGSERIFSAEINHSDGTVKFIELIK